jgi:hypothetical protein
LPRSTPLGFALGSPEAHEEAAALALVLGPLPAVLVAVELAGRQVGVQGVDDLHRRLETALDLPDSAHITPLGWLAASEVQERSPPDRRSDGEKMGRSVGYLKR